MEREIISKYFINHVVQLGEQFAFPKSQIDLTHNDVI